MMVEPAASVKILKQHSATHHPKWAPPSPQSTSAPAAPHLQLVPAPHTHARYSITQRSNVGAVATMAAGVPATESVLVAAAATWPRLLPSTLAPTQPSISQPNQLRRAAWLALRATRKQACRGVRQQAMAAATSPTTSWSTNKTVLQRGRFLPTAHRAQQAQPLLV